MIVLQIKRLLINESVTFTSVSVLLTTLDSTNGTAVTIELALPSTTDTDEVTQLLESYSEQYSSRVDNRGSIAVIPSSELPSTQHIVTRKLGGELNLAVRLFVPTTAKLKIHHYSYACKLLWYSVQYHCHESIPI